MSTSSSNEVVSFFANLAQMVDDEPQLAPPDITPSPDAIEIDAAHKIMRDAIGTPREAVARKYLEIVVEKVKARRGGAV